MVSCDAFDTARTYLPLQKGISLCLVLFHIADCLSLSVLRRKHGVRQSGVLSIEFLKKGLVFLDPGPKMDLDTTLGVQDGHTLSRLPFLESLLPYRQCHHVER
jgi:hypothetical protein